MITFTDLKGKVLTKSQITNQLAKKAGIKKKNAIQILKDIIKTILKKG